MSAQAASLLSTLKPAASAFFAEADPAQRDRHLLDAAVAQVLRVRVAWLPYRARRFLVGDQVEVGVCVVVNLHFGVLSGCNRGGRGVNRPRGVTGGQLSGGPG